jgi:hypothetical protein
LKRIILFRYHHEFERNRELLRFQQFLNPAIKIYGLYGGPPENLKQADDILGDVLEHNYLVQQTNPFWNWKNSDMSIQAWYNDYGYQLDFDQVHVLEWDLIFFESLENLFSHIPKNRLGLTGLVPLKKIEKNWYWTRKPERREEWVQLMEIFRKEFEYDQEPYGMLGPGISLPKSFLESIRRIEIPDLGNDELRIPLLAQACGFTMYDTGFYRKWFSKREYRYFNCNSKLIDSKIIEKQLKKKNGRRVFHPFTKNLSLGELKQFYELTNLKRKIWWFLK